MLDRILVQNNPVINIDPFGLELRIYNRPADGPIGSVGGNHAFLYSTEIGISQGMGASSGSQGSVNEPIDGLSYNVVPNPTGISEADVMTYMESTMNSGIWIPYVNDCHEAIDDTLGNFGMENPGAPGGRVGTIPNTGTSITDSNSYTSGGAGK